MKNNLLLFWEQEHGESYKITGNKLVNNRLKAAEHFAWGIPSQETLEEIAKYSPLIEIGAGKGYWAKLLRDQNVKIVPIDKSVPLECWTKVCSGGKEFLGNTTKTLFMCWIPEEAAKQTAAVYKGTTILWVGEEVKFANFKITKKISIPQWSGFKDSLFILTRENK